MDHWISGRILPPRGEGDKNIVLYDPILLKKYRCHVNLDFAGSAAVVKYLFKYMAKGADTLGMRREHVVDDGTRNTLPRDKIKEFIRGRYISEMLSMLHFAGIRPPMLALHAHTETGF